ncbi:hypothetical protein BC938DRAFT_481163 [Jimgerdemannia flammicorona]|uniref:Uncharacterized protein n=1 Tax=Jimgerdemannia flammicorona TaxID=994334 RepID=A0A433QGU8_9FUNG|nr:hypothetical protein BC938DRAFT_481163 [Jimgerdemannia flammicorona]
MENQHDGIGLEKEKSETRNPIKISHLVITTATITQYFSSTPAEHIFKYFDELELESWDNSGQLAAFSYNVYILTRRYENAYQYHNIFGPLAKMEADYDKKTERITGCGPGHHYEQFPVVDDTYIFQRY